MFSISSDAISSNSFCMLRFGLCCIFHQVPIRFRQITALRLSQLDAKGEKVDEVLSQIILDNLLSLEKAISYCHEKGIGSFRINSQLFPCYTHPKWGYQIDRLGESENIHKKMQDCNRLAKKYNVRLTFHPDQFVILNSPHTHVRSNSIAELTYHAFLAENLGADVINIHAGGVYGDKKTALVALEETLQTLSASILQFLTLENDDISYTPRDLYPLCHRNNIPLVYDVHHHRCNPDGWSVQEATEAALKTWKREPLFHLSSPLNGWTGPKPRQHHDFIDVNDFPSEWKAIDPLTVEIEAKAKEEAVLKLMHDLQ
jgi:UV DNA damage endonuclease